MWLSQHDWIGEEVAPLDERVLWSGKLTIETFDFGPADVICLDKIPAFWCFNRADAFLILQSLSGEEVEVIVRKRQ